MGRWIIPICIFLSLLLCTSGLSAKFIDASGNEVGTIKLGTDEVNTLAEGLAPIYTEDLIKSYGPVPEFDAEHHLKSSALASSFTNEKIWDDKMAKMDELYELTKKKIDTKYGYPRGPVISYGTDVFGSVLVGILEGTNVDNETYDQIYSIIQSNAKQIGIDNPPVIFFYSPMPTVSLGERDIPERFITRILEGTGTKSTLIYDITSLSSYSQFINLFEYGYNRDGESFPLISLL